MSAGPHRPAEALGIQIDKARANLDETDRARGLYVKHFYGRDWADTDLYQVVVDSTLLRVDTCVEIVLAAAAWRFGLKQNRSRFGGEIELSAAKRLGLSGKATS